VAKDLDTGPLVEIHGGAFRLTAVVQRRLRELVKGARPLVEVGRDRRDLLDIVLRELTEGKIEPTEEMGEAPAVDVFKKVGEAE
jgi:DNA-directed RNA polymerase subunit K/omega